ncbi:acylneuraminate cytidylyltransferase family protein [Magnetospirillum gryphiswaldense]|uniref:N-acylneuraminate cytidylyltransferase n=1 Tax=Magnetospirillum gryphiswaldense TaxID=55518 RepID=A4U181_9PROT|nr:acylneuraminate cytidylyltransferase family protein [Magnetospirillum gryphiswaldense]AVM75581.1 CMP-N,N'-diacetyllegionaminic acid synthase [Magnetospirillum gryphiswaldense MSR-1]AVM79484.1 CMP-N,N'-diacetyllegionaminic acid synthase [Magnetospirillum gryphiswaldense]CAM76638.1 N-acylneuraminate cytidylyltransferase [Magnetospirillum gryphiswaldense MSR-1]
MIHGLSVLAVVVGRGGSKGLPGKNVLPLGDRPMVAWSVAAARESKYVDQVILSSDDAEIIDAAKAAGCDVPFVRPAQLAADDSSVADVVLHALDFLDDKYDIAVLLQATSPLRQACDIDGCLELAMATDATGAVSVTRPPKPPEWMVRLDAEGRMVKVLGGEADRRQDLPPAYVFNGAVYVVKVAAFRQSRKFVDDDTKAYVMPPERSVDIDTPLDFLWAQALMAHARSQQAGD